MALASQRDSEMVSWHISDAKEFSRECVASWIEDDLEMRELQARKRKSIKSTSRTAGRIDSSRSLSKMYTEAASMRDR